MNMEHNIKKEIIFLEGKSIENKEYSKSKECNDIRYFEGKSESLQFAANKLRNILKWHGVDF